MDTNIRDKSRDRAIIKGGVCMVFMIQASCKQGENFFKLAKELPAQMDSSLVNASGKKLPADRPSCKP